MALRIDLADAPGPPHGALFGLAQIITYALIGGFIINIPFGLVLGLVSLVIPSLSAEALANALGMPVADLWWRAITPFFASIGFALLFMAWVAARNWRPPHHDAPMRTLMARLRRWRRGMPILKHRARLWSALNFALLFGLIGIPFATPQGSLAWLGQIAPVWLLIVLCFSTIAFLILNGARLLSGSGTFFGTVAWLLARAIPFVAAFLGPVIGGGLAFAVVGQFDGWAVLGSIAGAVLAWWCGGRLSQRFSALIESAALLRAEDALWGDRRRPILFLRSFTDDDQDVRHAPDDEADQENAIARLEDVIADELRHYGPVIAVGQPGVLPKSGAARAYYKGDDWQEAVATWMDQALVVVMVAGYTPGLTWEMDTLIKRGHTKKAIFVFPPDAGRRAERWARLRERFAYQPIGSELATADIQNVILAHADRTGNLVTFASPAQMTPHYRTALALALVGKFADGPRLRTPPSW